MGYLYSIDWNCLPELNHVNAVSFIVWLHLLSAASVRILTVLLCPLCRSSLSSSCVLSVDPHCPPVSSVDPHCPLPISFQSHSQRESSPWVISGPWMFDFDECWSMTEKWSLDASVLILGFQWELIGFPKSSSRGRQSFFFSFKCSYAG